MRILLLVFLLASGVLVSGVLADSQAGTCPDTAQAETQEDCPWAGIARTLSERAEQGGVLDLKTAAPELCSQIRRDSRNATFKSLWGESINFDELAKGIIVDPPTLKALAQEFKVPYISDRISHAGVEHTYGYLFSTLKTAFGYKRARWVHGDTDRGFGLVPGTLSPEAPKTSGGTLFSNASYFFGRIAFRTDRRELRQLKSHSSGVAESLRKFNYSVLKPVRLEEVIPSKDVILRTDLVPFTVKPESSDASPNQYLLVYSVVVNGHAKLITGFPVGQSFVDSTLNKDALGDNKPIMTRYNGYIEDVSGETFTGTRRVIPGTNP